MDIDHERTLALLTGDDLQAVLVVGAVLVGLATIGLLVIVAAAGRWVWRRWRGKRPALSKEARAEVQAVLVEQLAEHRAALVGDLVSAVHELTNPLEQRQTQIIEETHAIRVRTAEALTQVTEAINRNTATLEDLQRAYFGHTRRRPDSHGM